MRIPFEPLDPDDPRFSDGGAFVEAMDAWLDEVHGATDSPPELDRHAPLRRGYLVWLRPDVLRFVSAGLSSAAVARLLLRSERTLKRWRRKNIGPPFFNIGGCVTYRYGDVLAWLARHRVP